MKKLLLVLAALMVVASFFGLIAAVWVPVDLAGSLVGTALIVLLGGYGLAAAAFLGLGDSS